jgi:hypothetical protein
MIAIERRRDARQVISISLRWSDDHEVRTVDIGPHGLYAVIRTRAVVGDWVSLEFTFADAQMRFTLFGEVLRVEPLAGSWGVALKLHEERLFSMRELPALM